MSPNGTSQENHLEGSDGDYGSVGFADETAPLKDPAQQKKIISQLLVKTQNSFLEDATYMTEGTIPHSTVLAVVIGCACGVAAYVYYVILFWALDFVWHTMPEMMIIDVLPKWMYVLWIPTVGILMAFGVGYTVVYMGDPGDLPYTIKCVHEKAYVAMNHVMPMVCASQFSIIGGGSLGPEAPLVAICAAVGGFISRRIFKVTNRNLVRKHTLMGMAGALAAFFGCPLGGSLFAMEVNSRFGIEYFEHTIEAIFAGEICLVVFRGLANLPVEPIWEITLPKLTGADPSQVIFGAVLGLIGSLITFIFAKFHFRVMAAFKDRGLLRDENAVDRAMFGCFVIVILGMLVPHTMFWGEFEFDTISTMSPASTLEHIFPTTGMFGFEMDNAFAAFSVGVTKLIAISFTVAGGYRGGYIFPAMASGAAFGRVIFAFCPFIPVQLCVLCIAGAITVAITRTCIATTLILAYLSGEQNAISAILASNLVALFATGYMPFIQTQIARSDLDLSLYHREDAVTVEEEPLHGHA